MAAVLKSFRSPKLGAVLAGLFCAAFLSSLESRAEVTASGPALELSLVHFIQLRMASSAREIKADIKALKEAEKEVDAEDVEELADLKTRQKIATWLGAHRVKSSDPCEVAYKVFAKELPEDLAQDCEGYDPASPSELHGLAVASLESFEDLTMDKAKEAAFNAACGFAATPEASPFDGSQIRENWRWAVGLELDQIKFQKNKFEKARPSNPLCELYGLRKVLERKSEVAKTPSITSWMQARCEKTKDLWTTGPSKSKSFTVPPTGPASLHALWVLNPVPSLRPQCRDEKITISDYFACSFESFTKNFGKPALQSQARAELQGLCSAKPDRVDSL